MVETIVDLLPVLVGSLIGLGSVLASQLTTHNLGKKRAESKLKRERLEELVDSLFAHEHWLNVARDLRVFGNKVELGPNPLNRAKSIAAIYAPQLRSGVANHEKASREYEIWMFERAKLRLEGAIERLVDGQNAVYSPYYASLTDLVEATAVEIGRIK